MNSILLSDALLVLRPSSSSSTSPSKAFSCSSLGVKPSLSVHQRRRPPGSRVATVAAAAVPVARNGALSANSTPSNAIYTVGEFMTKKENLHVVKPTTTVDKALEMLVENRVTGFPVIDEDWTLVGVVSDYDLLALDSISGSGRTDTSMFPEVDSTWKTFNEIQKLLSKTDGKVVAEVMTPAPLVVRETTNLEDAARLLLETKYRRLPVVDGAGKLVGIITRGNVVRAALHMKHENEKNSEPKVWR